MRNNLHQYLPILLAAGCSASPEVPNGALLVRLSLDDPGAKWVGLRVWDERHELVRDDLLPADAFPRDLILFPSEDDPTSPRFRGAWIELDGWTEQLCPRQRAVRVLRYGEDTDGADGTELRLEAPAQEVDCLALFVRGDGTGRECSRDEPCDSLEQATLLADASELRTIVHVAGGFEYTGFGTFGRYRTAPAAPHVIRAWPGRSVPRAPRIMAPPILCREQADCENRSVCVDGRCADGPPIALCCDFNASGPISMEIDGLHAVGGSYGLEVNGASAVTVRHVRTSSAGGARIGASSGGIRVHRSSRVVLEHNLILDSKNLSKAGDYPDAAGLLVDGFGARQDSEIVIRYNRVIGADGPALLISGNNAPVRLQGNAWCNAAFGSLLERGQQPVRHEHDLFFGNELHFARDPGFEGEVLVTRSTFGDGNTSAMGLAASELSSSVVYGLSDPDSLVDPEVPPDVQDCLPGVAVPSFGVCATHPVCP